MTQAVAPVSVAEALGQAESALGFLASADWASLPGQVQHDALEALAHLQARQVAARTLALRAFDSGNGYRFDGCAGPVPWLTSVTRVSKAAAKEQAGWLRTFRGHPRLAQALIDEIVSDSFAKQFAAWNNRLPAQERDGADEILIDAAKAGLAWDDIARLAQEMYERSRAEPDEDQPFRDRRTAMERTFGGAGVLRGELSPDCAELLQKIFDALGKRLGPEDLRSREERQHDALREGLSRLLKAGLAPQSSGMDTKAMVSIPLAHLRGLPGSQALEQEWIEARLAESGWLSGPGADAVTCASEITPVVTGAVDWAALGRLTGTWLEMTGMGGEQACGCTCGGCTGHEPLTSEARLRLARMLLHLAVDTVSGPGGLAGFLRTRKLGAPFSSASILLDFGGSKDIPEPLRRAVIRRDRHCAWPGCDKPPAACEPHHLWPRSEGGTTEIGNLKLFCWFHHHVCIHRYGWQVTVHADGTVSARAPWGQELSNDGRLARTG